jgi:hypothetical protein
MFSRLLNVVTALSCPNQIANQGEGLGQRRPVLLYRAGVGASLGDLCVLSTSRAGNSDRPNYLAVCDNREAAIHRGGSTKTERAHADAALGYQILEDFGRLVRPIADICTGFPQRLSH